MPYTTNCATQLYYEVHGEGSPLVLISGLGGDAAFWGGSIEALKDKFQVIVFDNRGIGRSDMPDVPYTMELMADDLAALLDEIGVEHADVLGFSMGGNIAQAFALKYPHRLRKLVLAATFAKMNPQAELYLDAVLSAWQTGITAKQMYHLILPWLFTPEFLGQPGSAPFREFDENDPLLQPLYAFRRQYQAQKAFDSREHLSSLETPTLVIAGERDALVSLEDAQTIQERIPGAQLAVVKRAGHLFNIEQPEQFHQRLLNFLNQSGEIHRYHE